MPRRLTAERMDDPAIDPAELGRALAHLRGFNRVLGGISVSLRCLRAWSARWPRNRDITLLDIATGSADFPVAALRWADAAGFRLRITAIDNHPAAVEHARAHLESSGCAGRVELVDADARRLTDLFAPGSFDYTHAALFLHHLPDIEVLTVLRIMERLASRGMIWNDLARSPWTRIGARLVTVGSPSISRHDARASIEAAFTRAEVLGMRHRLSLGWCRYRAHGLAGRFTLAGEKPDAWLGNAS